MSGINVPRWLAGGVVAGVVIFILEVLAMPLYMDVMQSRLTELGLSMQLDAGAYALGAVTTLLVGVVLIFFYAASRTRFGAGVRTALIVSVVFYAGAFLPLMINYRMIGLYSDHLLALWCVQGLIETVIAGVAGAWVYRE